MGRWFIEIAYNGTNYHGWQIQPNAITVQQTLNECLTTILREEISVMGCGRTDTGVHATQFYAHFDTGLQLNKMLIQKFNSLLPKDISVIDLFNVKDDAHTRFEATSRTYEYHINLAKNPFKEGLSYYLRKELDLGLMQEACIVLKEFEDFTSFSKVKTANHTNICHISFAKWEQNGTDLVFTISANRFLRNMVRSIVGTMLDLGTGKISLLEFRAIIEAKDRREAGSSAPAQGLFLTKIEYPYL